MHAPAVSSNRVSARRACGGLLGGWLLAGCALAAEPLAERLLQGEAQRLGPAISMTQTQTDPLATATVGLPDSPAPARQTMLWAHRPGWALGLGIEERRRYEQQALLRGLPSQGAGLLLGLSLATSERTQLVVQTPLLATPARFGPYDLATSAEPRQLRLGLVFHKSDRLADLRRGLLMKVELSGQTTLSVKPRAGRIGFTIASQW